MVTLLQQQAASAVQVIQQAHQQADHSVQLAQDTGQRFAQLASAVEGINSANQSICVATAQQISVADEISQSIHQLNDEIKELSSSSLKAADASDMLKSLAEQLEGDCKGFVTAI